MRAVLVIIMLTSLPVLVLYCGYKLRRSTFLPDKWRYRLPIIYWINLALLLGTGLFIVLLRVRWPWLIAALAMLGVAVFGNLLWFSCVFLLKDLSHSFRKLIRWMRVHRYPAKSVDIAHQSLDKQEETDEVSITRAAFLMRTSLLLGATPYFVVGHATFKAAYDYQLHKHCIYLPRLPKAFDGIRIAQISDLHVGSFVSKYPLQRGIDLLMGEKPDIIFFTGDMVNVWAKEMDPYVALFSQLKAPLGVFSVLGNHDYGDYHRWSSATLKAANMQHMRALHKALGWQLLCNTSKEIRVNNESLAILGSENWGDKFTRYGDLEATLKGVEIPCRILLSHDPTHWEAEILKRKVGDQIALTCSGHTHGCQMGIETNTFRWSPVQYMYNQWAGLYQKEQQYLYVNRGFGFIGFPGRFGILPEITLLELKRMPV